MNSTTSEYRTVTEAAELLRVSVSTIRRWIRAGLVAAHRAGQLRLLVKRVDVTSAMRTVVPTANGMTRGALSSVPWPDRDASHPPTAAERESEPRFLAEAKGLDLRIQPRQKASGIMAPETWEVIREGRELRTEQTVNEIDPEFDEFDLGEVAHMIVHSPDRPRRRLLTVDEQRQLLSALEQANRTRERIRQQSGVDKFPPSEDIIAEMREERTRQLLSEDESDREPAT
jgi:excisionase family DNA binding protein